MTDRVQAITDLIAEYRNTDRDALLCAIISRWPDATGAEIQAAIDASRGQEGRLMRALEPARRTTVIGLPVPAAIGGKRDAG